MTDSTVNTADARESGQAARRHPLGNRSGTHLLRHLVEMLLAMVVGMLLLEPVWVAVHTHLGASGVFNRPDVGALVMATNMTAGMSVWMRYRGHRWVAVAEMWAAMYLPFLVLVPPFWSGMLSGDGLMLGGHVLMLVAMALSVLHRRDEYSGHHGHRVAGVTVTNGRPVMTPAPETTSHRIVTALRHRWPTWLALLVTVDIWMDPGIPSPWILLILPGAYVVIGAAGGCLREPRALALQLGGLIGYLVLTLVAVSVDEHLAGFMVAAGWLAHALWDLVHYRARTVVPRAYAELCGVVDVVIGLTIVVFLVW